MSTDLTTLTLLIADLDPPAVRALIDILRERARARAKWGPQPHPWDSKVGVRRRAAALERQCRANLEGAPAWSDILGEEAGEALREANPKRARAEVIQTGAMALAALAECPDLNGGEQ